MTTFNYPGHQRHIKKKIEARLEIARKEIIEAWNHAQQLRALDISIMKARGQELSEEDREFQYHPSFDDYAQCILWHMPSERIDEGLEYLAKLYVEDPAYAWSNWIHPRVTAVRKMQAGMPAFITDPGADMDLYWDDQIQRRYASDYGRDNNGWYEATLKKPKEEKGPTVESERDVAPKPPVFTPPPVARPWWMQLIDRLRR